MPHIDYPQLIEESEEELQKLEKHHRYTHLFHRVRMLVLLKSGECSTVGEAVGALGYSRRPGQRWLSAYKEGGMEELLTSRVEERVVPMSPKLRRSLRRYLKVRDELVPAGKTPPPHLFLSEKGERVTENTLRRRLYGWVRKSGIKKQNVKPHDLRRTFGTWFLQSNPSHVRELAELMGHSDLSQVMKYALSDEQRARAGVARL